MKFEFAILVGVSMANHYLNKEKSGSSSNNISFELQLETIFPKYNRTWSIFTGIGYRGYTAPLSIFGREE